MTTGSASVSIANSALARRRDRVCLSEVFVRRLLEADPIEVARRDPATHLIRTRDKFEEVLLW